MSNNKGRKKADVKPVVEIQPVSTIEIDPKQVESPSSVSSFSEGGEFITITIPNDFTGSINGKRLDLAKGIHEIQAKYLAYYLEYAHAEVING